MPLHPSEQRIWVETMDSFAAYDELSPVERASRDMRIISAARFLLLGEETACRSSEDCGELLAQIRPEYYLSPEDVNEALGIAEDRIFGEGLV